MRTTLFVANFGKDFHSEDLEHLFSKYGPVCGAEVRIDSETGTSRGFGFVRMYDEQGAESAIRALDGSWFAGRRLKVSKARFR